MTADRFREIMNDEEIETIFPEKENNFFRGIKIIGKYLPKDCIAGADHDVVFSADVNDIVKAGITEGEALELRKINWHLDNDADCLACFV